MHQTSPVNNLRPIQVSSILCATFLATLAVFTLSQSVLGQFGSTNCNPPAIHLNSSARNGPNPCASTTCTLVVDTFGSNPDNQPKCPAGGQTPGAPVSKYSLTPNGTVWTNCKAPLTSSGSPTCTETLAPCGTFVFYVDAVTSPNGQCRLNCGSSTTLGYCKAQ